ncbi:MAG: YfhO family protein, partial [Nitrososphaerales archaeon]
VGTSLVGFGVRSCTVPGSFGIPQDANVVYDVQELDVYDPITPRALFRSWKRASGQSAHEGHTISIFCPDITSADVARLYGVGFVLEPSGDHGPKGTTFVERIGGEALYRVPDSGAAIVVPLGRDGELPTASAPGTPVRVVHPDSAKWKLTVDEATPQVLRLHLTDVPGWHATIDGRPLHLKPFSAAMLQARIPAGTHTVELTYWPTTFSVGIAIAGLAIVSFVVTGIFLAIRRRDIEPASS